MYCELERNEEGSEHCGIVANTSASYLGNPQFES